MRRPTPFRGTLRCSYPISRVEVRILNAAGGDAITPATASPGSKSFDLSSLDNSVAFSRLRAGGYTLVITAESGAPTDGTFRLESPFYVSGDGFTVTFDPCGGTCGEAKRAVYAGQCYGDLPTAAKDGWTFDGWYTAPEGGSRIDGRTSSLPVTTRSTRTIPANTAMCSITTTAPPSPPAAWPPGRRSPHQTRPRPARPTARITMSSPAGAATARA